MKDDKRKKTLLIVGGLWLVFLMLNSFMSSAAIKTIPYSEFLRLAEEGRVSEEEGAPRPDGPARRALCHGQGREGGEDRGLQHRGRTLRGARSLSVCTLWRWFAGITICG